MVTYCGEDIDLAVWVDHLDEFTEFLHGLLAHTNLAEYPGVIDTKAAHDAKVFLTWA